MKNELSKVNEFISLLKGYKNVDVIKIEKDVVVYKDPTVNRKKHIRENLHSLTMEALSLISLKNTVTINIDNDQVILKINELKSNINTLDSTFNIKIWIPSLIEASLLFLEGKQDEENK